MNESIFKRIWNYSITVGQMIITAFAMAVVTAIVSVSYTHLTLPTKLEV